MYIYAAKAKAKASLSYGRNTRFNTYAVRTYNAGIATQVTVL